MKLKWGAKSSMIAAVVSGVAASLCCIGPFILLFLGIGGAWMSGITALAPFRSIAIIITVIFWGFAFWQLYFKPSTCNESGKICAVPRYLQLQRVIFWMVTIFLLLLITFPWYEQWLFLM